MLWEEYQMCVGGDEGAKKEPLTVEVCPLTTENDFAVGRKQWEISPDYG